MDVAIVAGVAAAVFGLINALVSAAATVFFENIGPIPSGLFIVVVAWIILTQAIKILDKTKK